MKKFLNLKNGLILLHVLFAIIGLLIYRSNYKVSEELLTQRTLNKQIIIAKIGSQSVENLLKAMANQLSSFVFSFAKIDENLSFDKDAARAEFASYIERASLPITGIALYDEAGKLIIIENREHVYTGENLNFSDHDFIDWAKKAANKNKVFISDPYTAQSGSAVGKIIMVLAEPIYFGNRYKGTLAIRILVDNFRKAFIDPLVSETDENSFILDINGQVISGKNTFFDKTLYNEFFNQLSGAIKNNKIQNSLMFTSKAEKSKILLAGVNRIDVPNTERDLYMVVVSSKDEITSSLTPLRKYGFIWLGFGVLTTIIGGFFVMFLGRSDENALK